MQGFIATASWDETMALVGAPDIYFSRGYHQLSAGAEGEASCFLYQAGEESFCFPIIETPIGSTGLKDFSTCYGYSGPLSTTDRPEFLARAWAAFSQCCRDRAIVAGFIRFHPLLQNHRFAAGSEIQTTYNRKTVYIDLTRPGNQIWNSKLNTKHYEIRRAEREGARFVVDLAWRHYDEFIALYRATMDRRHAAPEYLFSDQYFADLKQLLGAQGFLACVTVDDRLIAAAVILVQAPFSHYHLSGSNPEFRQLFPNALLLVRAAEYLRDAGYSRFHLGGGSDAREDNSLLYFKQRLSRDCASFYTGAIVVNRERYQTLCEEWERSVSLPVRERYLGYTLKYRFSL